MASSQISSESSSSVEVVGQSAPAVPPPLPHSAPAADGGLPIDIDSGAPPAAAEPNNAPAADPPAAERSGPPPLPPAGGQHVPPAAATGVRRQAPALAYRTTPSPAVTADEEMSSLAAFWHQVPSWLVSTIFHLACILMLAMYTVSDAPRLHLGSGATLIGGDGDGEGLDDGDSLQPSGEETAATPSKSLEDVLAPTAAAPPGSPSLDTSASLFPAAPQIDPLGALAVPAGSGGGTGGEGQLLAGLGDSIGNSLQARLSSATRARLVGIGGGTPGSEDAVGRGLRWLSEHQNTDGSWNFDHQSAPHCGGRCDHPGNRNQAQVAATGMALLPFLGAGETHLQGKYKRNVDMGLHFLGRAMHQFGSTGSMWQPGGQMYGHGLAAIALCEAYGMTRDPALQPAAQKAIDFIVHAQDPVGGGWRYREHEAGDTSVLGWQLMALKSASMAYLNVPQDTIRKAGYFLDSVQTEDGSLYGYTSPGRGLATTPIGLLCRMYMGWKHDHPPLVQGVQILTEWGPSLDNSGPPRNNMYYNYYATQVLHHYGGYEWVKWNGAMRDYLIGAQTLKGHATGSWYFEGTDMGSPAGGRLYCTAMATMILEVYYRHLPLYNEQTVKDTFN